VNNLGTWGTSREHDENMARTHWNKEDLKKKNFPHPTPKKEKSRPIMSACWDFPLAA
jgi:hypothetical protein